MERQTSLEEQTQQLKLEDKGPSETPESAKFRSLPQATQRLLLQDYPRLLARAMFQYSQGVDCNDLLHEMFEGSAQMLRVRNATGDGPIAVALLCKQDARAAWLLDLADKRNLEALEDRTSFLETLTMLSTSSDSAADIMERLLTRDPTQLHRLYDCDGRNLLHHCVLEESVKPLEAVLTISKRMVSEGRLDAVKVSSAVHMNDRSGDTPMHLMAARNRPDMLGLLVRFARDAGVDINLDERQHTGNRWTPLMAAAGAGATEAVAFLLDSGADPAEVDTEGRSAMTLAAGKPRQAELFAPFFEPDELEAAGHRLAESAGSAMAATPEPWTAGTVDSGIQSCSVVQSMAAGCGSGGSADVPDYRQDDDCPDTDEVVRLERKLADWGKTRCFLDAVSRLYPRYPPVQLMTQSPVVTAFSVWAHSGPVTRTLVAEALRSIGEAAEV